MTGETPTAIDAETSPPPFVVGVGASAGGLEALQRLFEKTELTGAFAFAVIQHLSPDFESVMGELLAPHTPLKVVRAQHGMKLEADHVYLMPPRHEMAVRDGHLRLTERDPGKGLFLPIDVFFKSLAEDAGPRAVGIVLSGTGSDGSRGVRAIHEAGGLVIAQDDSAKFDGMPRSAVDTGTVDVVLSPEAMGEALARYQTQGGQLDQVSEADPDVMMRIFDLLRRESGIDFAGYKGSTVGRRIQRRLLLTRSGDLGQYLDRIAADQSELRSLYCDLLIGVTRFFRDDEVFEKLRAEVVPGLVDALTNDDELRVWVAGCATGEEAYSVAIVVAEEFRRRNRLAVFRVFATDVHSASLEAASAGIYPADSIERVPSALRDIYFRPHRDGFQVSPDLRSHVVFAHHNLLRDAPFTRLDLVCCRNVLIYFASPMQRKALSAFHFGLKPNSVLLLGPSESPASVGDAFGVVDSRWKFFRKIRDARIAADVRNTPATFEGATRGGVARRPPEDVRVSRSRELLLQEYGPPSLVVDSELHLLHTFNAGSEFLTQKDGRPSLNMLDLVDGELRAVLSAAIRRAQRDMRTVRLDGVNVETARGVRQVSVVVRPVQGGNRGEDAWSISLEAKPAEEEAARPAPAPDRGELMTERVSNLEGELRFARENLQATIEEMETSNEELQATNEELIASNEELQSTNEELHSVNEELYTVNAEYQSKIAELTELSADMTHLLDATEVHTLFVDKDLRLRKFTPKIGEAFHLLPQDVGRRLDSFAHDFEDERLLPDLEGVLSSGATVEREVRDRAGRSYFLRIMPYQSASGIDGIVLTLIDLGALKSVQRDLAGVLEHAPAFIYLKDANGRYLLCGRPSENILGLRRDQIMGKTDQQLFPGPIAEARIACERRVIATGESAELEEQRVVEGEPRTFLTTVFPLRDAHGAPYAVAGICTDITEQKRASEEARRDVQRRDQFLAMLSHELRTPLGAILSATELIGRKGVAASGGSNAHDVIRRQARHMGRLIDDLLDVGRVTRQQLVLQTQIVDMREVIRDALDTVRREAERKDLELACTIAADATLTVRGDPVRLRQVVTNLAANAVTYTQTGRVAVEAGRSNGTVSVSVRDTGVGLAADEVTKVFDLFYQVPQPLDRPRGGLGVGLTLAQKLVGLHDGTLEVRSEGPGKGSLFTVNLPFAAATPVPVLPDDEPPRLRIVIVEDNDDNREMLAELLRSEGHAVWAADNGVAGTELILSQRPDVALVDVGLPGLDGFTVASRVRQETAGVVRLIALTGYGLPHDRARATECGFDRHILKPVEPNALFRVLREMVTPSA